MSEKTEKPTPKKLREAREKGEVAKSRDFTQTMLVLALFGYIVANGQGLIESLGELIVLPLNYVSTDFDRAVGMVIEEMAKEAARITLPFLLIVLVVGVFSEAIQTGFLVAFEALKPSAKRLNVISNAKNIFSKKNLIEFVKNVLKITVLSAVIYVLVRDALPVLMYIPAGGLAEFGTLAGELLQTMIVNIGAAYLVLALADLAWQRHEYTKKLMMSKDEVKQEYKTMEGDPHIKGQRKQLHQEMLAEGAVGRSRKASVLITNPTHLAIALLYDEESTPLPLVLAKGEGVLAQRMIDAAREAGVPVMQNIPLAHELFDHAQVDQYIPTDLIEPVAAVLRLVRKLAQGSSSTAQLGG